MSVVYRCPCGFEGDHEAALEHRRGWRKVGETGGLVHAAHVADVIRVTQIPNKPKEEQGHSRNP
jgi:hypothetical protein